MFHVNVIIFCPKRFAQSVYAIKLVMIPPETKQPNNKIKTIVICSLQAYNLDISDDIILGPLWNYQRSMLLCSRYNL